MQIVLDDGTVIEPTQEQLESLRAYINHPANAVPAWSPEEARSIMRPRWPTTDDWIKFHFKKLMEGVMETVPSRSVSDIDRQIEELKARRSDAIRPVEKGAK